MRQYELAIRVAQIHHLTDERKYKKALAVIRTLDMRQIKSLSDLSAIAEVYTKTEQFDAAKATYLRIYRKSRTRRILYKLIYLAIRTNELEEAEGYYQEFVSMAPSERDTLILRYRIDKASGVPIGQLIEILESLKEEEYIEEWAYELAKLYYKAGKMEECRNECEDIKLWFGSGEIVERAKKLIETVDDSNKMPFIDDKDFTIKEKEEANPDDTGSLPALNEYLQSKRERDRQKAKQQYEEENEEYEEDDDEASYNDAQDKDDSEEFIDDYDDDELDIDADIGKIAKEGLQKLSGLLKIGGRKEEKEEKEDKKEKKELPEDDEEFAFFPEYEIEKEFDTEQEKEPEEIRMAESIEEPKEQAQILPKEESPVVEKKEVIQENIPVEKETKKEAEITKEFVRVQKNVPDREPERERPPVKVRQERPKEPVYMEERHSQSGTGITLDLSREIAAIYEAEQREQLKEKAVTIIKEERIAKENAAAEEAAAVREELAKEVEAEQPVEKEDTFEKKEKEEVTTKDILEKNLMNRKPRRRSVDILENAIENTSENVLRSIRPVASETVTKPSDIEEIHVEKQPEKAIAEEIDVEKEIQAVEKEVQRERQEEIKKQERKIAEQKAVEQKAEIKKPVKEQPKQEVKDKAESKKEVPKKEVPQKEMPSVMLETKEPNKNDLPTTRALHKNFKDVLLLISYEPDPSHFVLVGEGSDKIIGITKKIVKVMRDAGYMSRGRIARISAKQLNNMRLPEFKDQLKGNCLLVDEAAELMVPTIAKLFEIMDEYYGDFVVILADRGKTLDQLFQFAPVLSKKFKYVIDISEYSEVDYL